MDLHEVMENANKSNDYKGRSPRKVDWFKSGVFCENCEYFTGWYDKYIEVGHTCKKSITLVKPYFCEDMNKNNNCQYYKLKRKWKVKERIGDFLYEYGGWIFGFLLITGCVVVIILA